MAMTVEGTNAPSNYSGPHMSKKTAAVTSPRMSDEAVKAKTGKVWKEWFAILDLAGAK